MLDELLPKPAHVATSFNGDEDVSTRWERLRLKISALSDHDLAEFEDELDFYTFTGIANSRIRTFRCLVD